jgi:DUF4097 and DUF4098 domain-containing protein YvlB
MTGIRRIFVCAALLLVVPALAWSAQDETERVHKVVSIGPNGTLKLKSFSGEVRITGTDGNDVVVDAVRKAPKERLDRIKLDIQSSGSTVTIEANRKESSWWDWGRDNVVETTFDIQVPRKTSLDVSVFSSGVTIKNVSASEHLHGFSSSVQLEDVTGPIAAKTFSGDIHIALASGIDRPDLNIDTFSGDIEVRVPPSAKADVNFHSFSGDLTSDLPLTLRSKSRHNLSAQLNAGGGSGVRFKTFSGDVRIRR